MAKNLKKAIAKSKKQIAGPGFGTRKTVKKNYAQLKKLAGKPGRVGDRPTAKEYRKSSTQTKKDYRQIAKLGGVSLGEG